jgi:hypothetical protein
MPDEPAELKKEEEITNDEDAWDNRVLCIDESCIGVIGPDGRCKECGKTYKESPSAEMDMAQSDSVPQKELDEQPTPQFDDSWEKRTLCSDESCIGVVGPDGRCKECGKPHAK